MIQISDSKKEKMSECAEKVLRYAGKLMSCIEELGSDERYGERREMDNDDYDDSERYGERGGRMRRPRGSFRY